MASQYLQKYVLEGGVSTVSGWLGDGAIAVLLAIDHWQKRHGIMGDVAEIGVHHGKLFILLKNMCRDDEFAVAIDVFEDQHLNADHSGHGDRQIFERQLSQHTDGKNISIWQMDSATLSARNFGDRKVRIFSIDGSHTVDHTVHDLVTATSLLAPGGVVALDDLYNGEWPGVQEGFHQFMTRHRDDFGAVAYGDKMIVARREDHQRLLEFFKYDLARFTTRRKQVVVHRREAMLFAMKPPSEIFEPDGLRLPHTPLPNSNVPFRAGLGWANNEANGIWSITGRTEIELDLEGRPRMLSIGMRPFLPRGRLTRGVRVTLAGRLVAARELAGPAEIALELPPDIGAQPVLSIEIEHPDRPVDFGGADVRALGICLTRINQSG